MVRESSDSDDELWANATPPNEEALAELDELSSKYSLPRNVQAPRRDVSPSPRTPTSPARRDAAPRAQNGDSTTAKPNNRTPRAEAILRLLQGLHISDPDSSESTPLPSAPNTPTPSTRRRTVHVEDLGAGTPSVPSSPTLTAASRALPRQVPPQGFLPYPSISQELRRQPPEPPIVIVPPLPTFSKSLELPPQTPPRALSSRSYDHRPVSAANRGEQGATRFDEILDCTTGSLPIEVIVSCPKTTSLDSANIAFGVQYELARGVQLRRWSWDDLTSERIQRLKGTHAEVMPKLNEIMGTNKTEPVHKMALLWEEYDREQAAILENKGRGLGLRAGTFYGFEGWYGGRIQQVVRLEVNSDGPRPFSLYLEPPEMKRSYRAARLVGSRRILIVKTSSASPSRRKQYPHVDDLAKRFVLLGRVYIPFDAKDGHIYMVETDEDYGRLARDDQGDFTRMSFQDFIRASNPISLNSQQPISKWATRFDLSTSTSIPALEFAQENIVFIEDIVADGCDPTGSVPAEKCMTDGGGFLNGAAATLIAQRIHLTERPTAIQGRIAGSKGVWVLHPKDRSITEPPRIWIRHSQRKIHFPDLAHPSARCHRIFDLVQPSRVTNPARLSMQLLLNMSHNGVPDKAFVDLLDASLREETKAFTDWKSPYAMPLLWAAVARAGNVPAVRLQRILPGGTARAMGLAKRFDMERAAEGAAADVYSESETQTDAVEMDPTFKFVVPDEGGRAAPESLHETVMELIQAGFRPQESSHLYQKLKYVLDLVIDGIVGKYRIPVPRSAEAYAIADPLGVLEEGEVHFRSSTELGDPLTDNNPYVLTGDVLICRHPTRLKSDIRKVHAINHPSLAAYTDVIIVPLKGARSLMSELSGGDLDGDTLWITWEPTLVEPFKNAPLGILSPNFIKSNFETNGERLSSFCERLESDSGQFTQQLVKALLGGISDRKVGLYSKFHDFACWKLGYDHPDVERLAHMFTTCLDANKTGLRVMQVVFSKDSREWDIANLPSCLRDIVKGQSATSLGPYAQREAKGTFVLETIRDASHSLTGELWGEYDNLKPRDVLDPDLLAPSREAVTFAAKMLQEHRIDAWKQELHVLRKFVQSCRDEWPSAASPQKRRMASDRDKSIKALAARFQHDAPAMPHFALTDCEALRASLAYELCWPGNESFGFAIAFRDLCEVKAKARGDTRPMIKELGEAVSIAKSTRHALGAK